MEKWTVILRGPNGLDFEVVEADSAEWSEDGKRLVFTNLDAASEVLTLIQGITSDPKREMTPDETMAKVKELSRAIGRFQVASFEREAVLGYFIGLRTNADVRVTLRPTRHE